LSRSPGFADDSPAHHKIPRRNLLFPRSPALFPRRPTPFLRCLPGFPRPLKPFPRRFLNVETPSKPMTNSDLYQLSSKKRASVLDCDGPPPLFPRAKYVHFSRLIN
jgi:hypothetical protein